MKRLSCIALNCNSLVSLGRRKELESFVRRFTPQIVMLSETHLNSRHKLRINGYTVYRADSGDTKSGGTAILIKNGIPHFEASIFKTSNSQATLLKVGTVDHYLALCSIYVTNVVRSDIEHLLGLNPKTVIAGDFNARHSTWNRTDDNANGRSLFNICSRNNVQVNFPLGFTFPQSKSTLDLVLTKNVSLTEIPVALDEYCSDHLPVMFHISLQSTLCASDTKKALNFAKTDWLAFKTHIQRNLPTAPHIDNTDDIDQMATLLTNVINSAINISVPKTTLNHLDISPELELLIQTRNRLSRLHYKDPVNCPLSKTEINRLSGVIRQTVHHIQNEKFQKRMEEVPENSNDIFNEIRKFRGQKSSPFTSIRKDSHTIIDPSEIAEEIASHYTKVHSQNDKLGSSEFDEEIRSQVRDYLNAPNANLDIPLTDMKEVSCVLQHIKKRKAPGVDNIPNSALRNLPEKAICLLADIINAILKYGHFPRSWKVGKVIPIPKPGKPPEKLENTRPITLLNGLSKITEALMLRRMQPRLDSHLPEEQFGFRAKHHSTQALSRLINFIKESDRHGKSTIAAFLDIEKAFDTVWHDGLVYKLIKCNFPFYLIRLVNSYLRDREFFVSIGEHRSTTRKISAGVAQGSLLGPHLFAFFYHDLPRQSTTQTQIFADDTTIYTSSTSARASCERLEGHLGLLSAYADKWKIRVNTAKTELVHFFERRASKFPPAYPISFQGSTLTFQDHAKYLGVVLTKKLSASLHIKHVTKRAFTALNSLYPFLNRNSKMSEPNKLKIYKVYLRPVLTYAVPAWAAQLSETQWKKISVHQNRALRFVFNKWPMPPDFKHFPIKRLEELANIEPLSKYSRRLQANFIEKCLTSEIPIIKAIPHKWDLEFAHSS